MEDRLLFLLSKAQFKLTNHLKLRFKAQGIDQHVLRNGESVLQIHGDRIQSLPAHNGQQDMLPKLKCHQTASPQRESQSQSLWQVQEIVHRKQDQAGPQHNDPPNDQPPDHLAHQHDGSNMGYVLTHMIVFL